VLSTKRRRERIGETPDCAGLEFLVLRFEVKVVHNAGQVFRSFQLALDECLVDDHFRGDIG